MILPEELTAKAVIPALRALVIRRLIQDYRMTQAEAAQLMGVTQPAASKYIHEKRGAAIHLNGIKEVERLTGEIAKMVSTKKAEKTAVMRKMEAACEYIRKHRFMCDLHKRLEPDLDINSCRICDR